MDVERIIFFGTPDFAVASLKALLHASLNVPLVVTQPDQPFGRGKKTRSPAVKEFCAKNSIPCLQPVKIKSKNFLSQIADRKPSLFVVAAYGRILSQVHLDIAPLTINVHASLLPRWRGASPISSAILAGDKSTGISIMKVVQNLDAGPVLLQKSLPIMDEDDTATLTGKLGLLGGECLVQSIEMLRTGQFEFREQDERLVTYAPMLNVEDAKIQWNDTAEQVHNHIRAYAPNPGAFTFDEKERIKIYRSVIGHETFGETPGSLRREKKHLFVSCKDRWIEILELQRTDKTRQGIVDFLNGYPKERIRWT